MPWVLTILCCTFSLLIQAYPVLISEIFAHAPGRKSDQGRQWIEVTNQGAPISITHLNLTIHSGKTKELILSRDLSLAKPFTFSNYLVIAQSKNLGLSRCRKDDQSILAIENFRIDPGEYPRICVTINNDVQTCVTLGKKTKISDGVSLFRDADDLHDLPLWRHEPCHLMDSVFASPGLPPIFCQQEKINIDALFIPCDQKSFSFSQPIENKINLITRRNSEFNYQAQQVLLTNDKLAFSITGSHPNSLTMANICRAPVNSEKICHIIDEIILRPTEFRYQFIVKDKSNDGQKYFLQIASIDQEHQKIDTAKVEIASINDYSKWRPDFSTISQRDDLVVTLRLHEDDLPLNFMIKDDNHTAIYQRAFLSPGEKTFTIPNKLLSREFYLAFSGKAGDFFDEKKIFFSG